MTEHTPGPLTLVVDSGDEFEDGPMIYIDCAEGARAGMDHPKARTIVDPESGVLTIADARRLIACWNACQPIPTEVLEGVNLEVVAKVRP